MHEARPYAFTYDALGEIYAYYNKLCEESIPFNAVSICREWSEDTEENVLKSYGLADLAELDECTFNIVLESGNVLYRVFKYTNKKLSTI